MKIAIGVLTHNAIGTLRWGLLEKTLESLAVAFPGIIPFVMDNGSTDGLSQAVCELQGGFAYVPGDGNATPGRGRNHLIPKLVGTGADLIVCSDDDMVWRPGALDAVTRFWRGMPDVAILSGLFEPDWAWNTPRGVVESGGVKALWRDSAPAAAWTFPAQQWQMFGPVIDDFGEDYDACQRLTAMGLKVAQVDLAEHAGWGMSTHGNRAIVGARPVDRKAWGLL